MNKSTPSLVAAAAVAVAACLWATNAHATNYVWGGAWFDWTNASAWSPSGVPGTGDTVTINSGQVQAPGPAKNVAALTLSGGGISTAEITTSSLNFASGTLSQGVTLTVTGPAQFDGSSYQVIDATSQVTLQGTTTWSAGGGSISSLGTVNNAKGAVFVDQGSPLSNDVRLLAVQNKQGWGGTFNNAGTYVRNGLGTTEMRGMAFSNSGSMLINSGTLQIDTGFTNAGTLTMAQGALLASTSTGFGNRGLLQGNGSLRTLSKAYAFLNSGTIDPGAAGEIGALSVTGDLSLASKSVLHIDLGSGNTADLISVSDQLTLGGSLQLGLLDGAVLHEGDVFTIATFASYLGSGFASVDWHGAGGYGFSVIYNAHDIQLRVASVPMPVPEPANATLALCALMILGVRSRRAAAPLQPPPALRAERLCSVTRQRLVGKPYSRSLAQWFQTHGCARASGAHSVMVVRCDLKRVVLG